MSVYNDTTLRYFFTILLTGILLQSTRVRGQQYVSLTDEILTVNSRTAIGGNTRNITHVVLPDSTIGVVYRISVSKKGTTNVSNLLFNVLQTVNPRVALASSLAQFVIANRDGQSVDAFIFTNKQDVDNFSTRNDGYWTACKEMLNRSNCCIPLTECIQTDLYFGFRNNNVVTGLDVKLEIVAITK